MGKLDARDRPAAWAAFGLLAALYWRGHCRTFGPGDSPQHVLSALTWGVSRPPGYPLYTALAHALSGGCASLVNAFSGLLHAAAGAVFFLLLRRLGAVRTAAAAATAMLCLSPLYWYYSEVAEVRALNDLLAIASAYLALSIPEQRPRFRLILTAIVLGLGVGHHPTFVLILPAVLLLLAYRKPRTPDCVLGALIAVSTCAVPYVILYLRLHVGTAPVYNPDGVRTARDVLDLFLRKNTGGALSFASGLLGVTARPFSCARFRLELGWFGRLMWNDLLAPGIVLAGLGLWRLWIKDRRTLAFLALWVLGTLLPVIFVSSQQVRFGDLDYTRAIVLRFYLLPLIGLFASAGFGLDWMLSRSRRELGWALAAVAALCPLFYRPVDLHRSDPVRSYAEDILRSSGPRDFLFVQSDEAGFSLQYLDRVEHATGDRVVLAPALFRNRTYIDELQRRHPDLKLPRDGEGLSLSVSRWMKDNPDRPFDAEPTWRDRMIQISTACYPQGILLRLGRKFPSPEASEAQAREFLDGSAAERIPSWGLRPWTQEVYLLKAYAMMLEFYGSFLRRPEAAALEERRARAFAAIAAVR